MGQKEKSLFLHRAASPLRRLTAPTPSPLEWPLLVCYHRCTMTAEEIQWLAGLLDGEGCWYADGRPGRLGCSPRLELHMSDLDVVTRAAALAGGNVLPYHVRYNKATGRKPTWCVRVPAKNIPTVTLAVSPWLSDRRRAKCTELGLPIAPREPDTWAWFAGLVEGEGCFDVSGIRSYRLRIGMTDRDVIERASALAGGNVCHTPDPRPASQDCWTVRTPVARLRTDVIENIGPWLGERRHAKCVELGLLLH
jgi:hypothetical protein